MEKDFKYILNYGLPNYFNMRNLKSQTFQKIMNSNKGIIGHFFNASFDKNCKLTQNEVCYFGSKNNNFENISNNLNLPTFINKSKLSGEIRESLEPHFISLLLCLYQIKEFKNYFVNINNNEEYKIVTSEFNYFFKNFDKIPSQSLTRIQINLFKDQKFDNYQNLIQKLFSTISTELSQNIKTINEPLDTTQQFDENKGINKFKERHKRDSIIEKTFYSIKEIKSFCKNCFMTSYSFSYIPFILIEPEKEETNINLAEKIFNLKIEEKDNKCNFCGGGNNKCKIEIKIYEFSKILIIIITDKIQKYSNK